MTIKNGVTKESQSVLKNLVPDAANETKERGIFRYTLTLKNITENGRIVLRISEKSIYDRAKRYNRLLTLSLDLTADNEGPNVGIIQTNGDEYGRVFGDKVELEVTATDDSGIESYEWQVSKDGKTWKTFDKQQIADELSKAEYDQTNDGVYSFRVIVKDIVGNTSVSQITKIDLNTSINRKPTIRFESEQISSTKVKIIAIIKSTKKITSVTVNATEVDSRIWKDSEAKTNNEWTITVPYEARDNGEVVHHEKHSTPDNFDGLIQLMADIYHTLKKDYSIEETPRQDFVKYLLDLKMTQALAVTGGKKEKAEQIAAWFKNFDDLLKRIFDDDSVELVFDEETFQFTIHMNDRDSFDFNTLSSGYAAVLDIVVDLIIRMESQTDRKFDFSVAGIVLIDEIETHLHLELQRKILDLLTSIFPNIQFILSTHSPFIINSVDNAVIYDLEKNLLVENGLSDVPYAGIVEGYFNSNEMSMLLQKKFNRYKELVDKEKLTDEDYDEISELEMYLNEIPDYLALNITTEYQRLKEVLRSREDI